MVFSSGLSVAACLLWASIDDRLVWRIEDMAATALASR
jgi:hypothetical protein